MVKLIKKSDKPLYKTTCWVVEQQKGMTDKRKQFTLYNTTLEEVEEILTKDFKQK